MDTLVQNLPFVTIQIVLESDKFSIRFKGSPKVISNACIYEGPNNKKCTRLKLEVSSNIFNPYCSLHYGLNQKPTDECIENQNFVNDFEIAFKAKDGNWCGFVFPMGFQLPKEITFAIDAQDCRFEFFDQSNVIFKKAVNFSNSIFKGDLILRNCIFEETISFDKCQFQGRVEALNVKFKKHASFYRAEFMARAILRANFVKQVIFNEAIFRDDVIFSGWRETTGKLQVGIEFEAQASGSDIGKINSTLMQKTQYQLIRTRESLNNISKRLQKKSIAIAKQVHARLKIFHRRFAKVDPDTKFFRVFESGGSFQGVIILKPDQTLFSEVDLSRVHFLGTNLRGIRFVGVNWWQPALKRNGLYDEVFIRMSKDGPLRHSSLPALEEACRNARVALEENKSFNVASDFYIGEMEAVREQHPILKRHLFSVTALYKFVSRYGTNVGVAVWVLSLIFFLHITASIYFQLPDNQIPQMECFLKIVLRSLKLLLLQKVESIDFISPNTQDWLDASLRLFGPIQIAMVAIAFRARIKRN